MPLEERTLKDRISMTLDPALLQRIEALRAESGETRSEIISRLLNAQVANTIVEEVDLMANVHEIVDELANIRNWDESDAAEGVVDRFETLLRSDKVRAAIVGDLNSSYDDGNLGKEVIGDYGGSEWRAFAMRARFLIAGALNVIQLAYQRGGFDVEWKPSKQSTRKVKRQSKKAKGKARTS